MKLQDLWPFLSETAAERLSELLGRVELDRLPEVVPMTKAEWVWLRARMKEAKKEEAA